MVARSKLLRQFSARCCQMAMQWSHRHRLLFSGGADAKIHAWDIRAMDEKFAMQVPPTGAGDSNSTASGSTTAPQWRLGTVLPLVTSSGQVKASPLPPLARRAVSRSRHSIARSAAAMELLCIDELDVLASGGIDTVVRLWDYDTKTVKQSLRGHSKTVRSLAYMHDYKILVSAGFDHEALVWNPFLSRALLPLRGHNAPLVRCMAVPGTPQLVTADSSGCVKIWDVRRFSEWQTLKVDTIGEVGDAVLLAPDDKIVLCGTRLQPLVRRNQAGDPDCAAQSAPSLCVYNSTSATFITAAGRDVRVWDANTGHLTRTYQNIADSAITALCLDGQRQRKFCIATHTGVVTVHDALNGTFMKTLHTHGAEVSSMLYCDQDKTVVTSSWDGSFVVADELDPDRGIVLKHVTHAHTVDILCCAASVGSCGLLCVSLSVSRSVPGRARACVALL